MFMRDILDALKKRYEAEVDIAKATIQVYLDKPVGIGEHPQFIEELDKLMSKIAEAEDKLTVVNQRFDEDIPF